MTRADFTRASSTEIVIISPTLDSGRVPDVRHFSATLVAAGKTTMNLQHIAHNRADVIITFTYVNHALLIGKIIMPCQVMSSFLHKVTQEPTCICVSSYH